MSDIQVQRRSRGAMAAMVARDIPDGSFINLGIGMPVLVLDHLGLDRKVMVHSENGVLGMRPLGQDEPVDPEMTNAAKLPVGIRPGASFFHHADSFAMMRGGHLDYAVLGAYQVSATGDLANWSLGEPGVATAVGGAMDLAVGAKQVFVMMEHQTREGTPRLLERCTLPLTGLGAVRRVYTDLATLDVTPQGFLVRDMAEGLTPEALQSCTGAPLRFA
ncbi:3-oxoacid CoA-transferase subunit B [Pararoseomonas sp. SCSIO 73927]|uniref:3-oxoacid CoA-transferase subunit B n=1 Tax=Pararoseomonas sp. SCSIO 73927 TaxID=3114537 RepID=UPI0030D49F54